MRDLPNLDFLRACAVLTVVVEHTLLAYQVRLIGSWQTAWIGVVGVFVFFVHTSLVLMWSLERRPHTLDFYIRRAFRIYPLAWLVILVTLAAHLPVTGGPHGYFEFLPLPPSSLTRVKMFFLMSNIASYGQYLPVGVMWSLPYEVEMYLLLPLLFFFARKNFSIWPLLGFWVFLMLANRPLFPGVPHNIYLCIPYFLPGIIAYVGFGRHKAFLPAWLFPCFLVGLWAWFMPDPGWRKADFLCLALGLALPLFRQIKARPLISVSHQIAKYSYGAYLSHPFAIALGLLVLRGHPLWLQITVVAASTAAFSVAAYHLLELPMIRWGSRVANWAEQRYEQKTLQQFRIAQGEIS